MQLMSLIPVLAVSLSGTAQALPAQDFDRPAGVDGIVYEPSMRCTTGAETAASLTVNVVAEFDGVRGSDLVIIQRQGPGQSAQSIERLDVRHGKYHRSGEKFVLTFAHGTLSGTLMQGGRSISEAAVVLDGAQAIAVSCVVAWDGQPIGTVRN